MLFRWLIAASLALAVFSPGAGLCAQTPAEPSTSWTTDDQGVHLVEQPVSGNEARLIDGVVQLPDDVSLTSEPATPCACQECAPAAAADATQPQGIWRLLPEGVVPIWGPRTSPRHRNLGLGQPLTCTSWLPRPYSAGFFGGAIAGDQLLRSNIDRGAGAFGGFRFGWDYDYYWGIEKRFSFGYLHVSDVQNANDRRTANATIGDVNLLFYPWGDSRWRPYIVAGVGLAEFNFVNNQNQRFNRLMFETPFGLGVKYLHSEWLATRVDLIDNLAIGRAGVGTMDNISLTAGLDIRYGGFRFP